MSRYSQPNDSNSAEKPKPYEQKYAYSAVGRDPSSNLNSATTADDKFEYDVTIASMPNKKKEFKRKDPIPMCLIWANEHAYTPFSFHRDEDDGHRVHHYKATMFWMTLITFVLATAIYATNTGHAQDKEHSVFNGLDHFGHQAFAVVALAGLSAAIGAMAGGIHYGINYFRGTKDRSDYGIQLEVTNSEDRKVNMGEQTGLMGTDDDGASVVRVGAYNPLNLIYPATPLKTIAWVGAVMLATFVITSAIRPDFFNEIAGDAPLANGTFTNCTVGNQTFFANNSACVSELGHAGAVATLAVASAAGAGGIATLFHYAGAKIQEKIEKRTTIEYVQIS